MRWFSALTYQRKSEIFGFLLIVVCLFIGLSLATHAPGDDEWISAGPDEEWVAAYQARNLAGTVGALVAYAFNEWFGLSAFFLTLLIGAVGVRRFLKSRPEKPVRYAFWLLVWVFVLGVAVDLPIARTSPEWVAGALTVSGQTGRQVAEWVSYLLGVVGGILVLGSILLGAVLLAIPWKKLNIQWSKKPAKHPVKRGKTHAPTFWSRAMAGLWRRLVTPYRNWQEERRRRALADAALAAAEADNGHGNPDDLELPAWATNEQAEDEPPEPAFQFEPERPAPAPRPRPVPRHGNGDSYQLPTLDLLAPLEAQHRRRVDGRGAELLAKALETFDVGIDGPIEAFPGPVITRYEFRPAPGVKVNQVVGLADDLALALSASRVRIVAPVPGKAAVGIEVPNHDPDTVQLAQILGSPEFLDSDAALPLALGETIDGQPYVADLANMPHLLIAGATGSGKSVCINVIITSLLFRHHPNDVRLLFVDPKRLELSVYAGIPHMERPVVTHPRAAERLLADATKEMDERYRLLASQGVRNVADFNTLAPGGRKLPYIIIVVDELADLMMSQSAARIELLITRLAQMARAVGIHLILATQRPSVDVITGLIKANFSCRIAFQVASKIDSRTILDGNGAEKLLGRGDMLFLSPGKAEPTRIHGAYISGAETTAIVEFLRSQMIEPEALPSFSATVENDGSGEEEGDEVDDHGDRLFQEAAELVVRHQQGSVSLLQRRLGIGYQRAARLIDRLEEAGVVGPYDGSKAREVLWTMADYEDKFARAVS
ncbi:MAG: DNA translocase FtsK 4TM domain-containing protein [Candidatus Zixiibacteriota bacterium]